MSTSTSLDTAQLASYLRRFYAGAELVGLEPLGAGRQAGLKEIGYGRPLLVSFKAGGREFRRVLRTMGPDRFGHDRRADRAACLLLARDSFAEVPRHVRALDVGAFAPDGSMVSLPGGEIYLLSEYVDGELYADDLTRLARETVAPDADLARARALADYLAELHARPADPETYIRVLRDTVGSGEGIFGLADNYPQRFWKRLEALERQAVGWRWRLRAKTARACRTHGDFHPFNILFRAGCDFSVLDTSRGSAGEPADDLTALSINYLFFSLTVSDAFAGALRQLWKVLWDAYLERTRDHGLLEVVAPFFAWRALVLAHPLWYPDVSESVRDRLLGFAERLLGGACFWPDAVETLL